VCGLTFYSHLENTCIRASFHYEGRFGPIRLVYLLFSTHTFFIEAHLPSQESMGHVYACWEYRILPLILRLFDSNLELSRMCCILCLSLNILKQIIVKNIPKLVRYFQQKLPIITLYNHRKTKIQWVHV
jgi:hypothetical protein